MLLASSVRYDPKFPPSNNGGKAVVAGVLACRSGFSTSQPLNDSTFRRGGNLESLDTTPFLLSGRVRRRALARRARLDAPDDAAVTAFSVKLGSLGNVKTQTMRAFRREEMEKILAKIK